MRLFLNAFFRVSRRAVPLGVLLCLLAGTDLSDGAIFVKIPNVGGDVATEGYDDGTWFEARSGSYGAARDLIGATQDGTANLSIGIGKLLPLGLACDLNLAAAPLLQAAASGDSIGDVEIHLVDLKPEPVAFAIVKLSKAFVKDFTMDSSPTERPWYQAYLVYDAIEITNRFSRPSGIQERTASWDLLTGTGSYRDATVANQAPTITPVNALAVAEDSSGKVSLTVSDPDGPAAELSVAATSSNPALLPTRLLAVSGEGATRSLTFTPAPNQSGTVVVTVVVSDLTDSVSTSFELTVNPLPDPPALAGIDPQVTTLDTPASVLVNPSDPDQSAETLTLAARSGNQRLLPDANIVFENEGSQWLMTVTPAPAQAGSAEIEVIVTDDTGRSALTRFLFTVNSASNSAPTDIVLEPGALPENSPPGTVVGSLRAVDPDGNGGVVFELLGDAQGRFRLVDGVQIVTTGLAVFDYEEIPVHRIFVRATDPDGAIFGRTLEVAVTNVNEAPRVTINLPSTIPASTPTAPIPIPIPYPNIALSDPDAGGGDVTVTFVVRHGVLQLDDTGTLFGKVSGNETGSVTVHAALGDILLILRENGFTYLPDPGYEGADSIAITIEDNGQSGTGASQRAEATESFFVRSEAIFTWLDEFFSPQEQADPEIGGLFADFDRDHLDALLEYKLVRNPRDSSDALEVFELSEVTFEDQNYLQIAFVQRTDGSTPNTRLRVEVADDLSGWESGAGVVVLVSRTLLGDERERLVYRLVRSRSEQPRQFLRLSATYTGESG